MAASLYSSPHQQKHLLSSHARQSSVPPLPGRFDRGWVHCTPSTARLAAQQLGVHASRLVPHPLDEPFELDGTRITFVDANHCPGAAMIVFEAAGPGHRRPVLHTGDCRLVRSMQAHPALAALRGRADLILDTTYCDPAYTFPSQEEARGCGNFYALGGG